MAEKKMVITACHEKDDTWIVLDADQIKELSKELADVDLYHLAMSPALYWTFYINQWNYRIGSYRQDVIYPLEEPSHKLLYGKEEEKH